MSKKGKFEGKRKPPYGLLYWLLLGLALIPLAFLLRLPAVQSVLNSAWLRYLLKGLFSACFLYAAWHPKHRNLLAESIIVTVGAGVVWTTTVGFSERILLLAELLLVYAAGACMLYLRIRKGSHGSALTFMMLYAVLAVLSQSQRYTYVGESSFTRCWFVFLALGVVAAAVIGYLIYRGQFKLKKNNTANKVLTCFVAAYVVFALTWQTVENLNYILDTSEPVKYDMVVQDMSSRRSGRHVRRYYLIAAHDGQQLEFSVSLMEYIQYEVGDQLSVALYEGAWGDAYYMIE